ncbi:MAG: hypothetical protein ACKV19_26185 [Verrucomicrobiales bacterium]
MHRGGEWPNGRRTQCVRRQQRYRQPSGTQNRHDQTGGKATFQHHKNGQSVVPASDLQALLAIVLAPGSGWPTTAFDLSDLVSGGTVAPVFAFMTTVAQMRIIHSPQPLSVLGEAVVGSLGVDNITSVPDG